MVRVALCVGPSRCGCLFFLITAPDYGFFKLLNVAILTLSAFVGLRFLTGGTQVLNEQGLMTPGTTLSAATPATTDRAPALVNAEPVPALVGAATANAVVPAADAAQATSTAAQPVFVAQVHPNTVGGHAVHPPLPVRSAPAGVPGEQRPASMTLLYIWIMLFGFVGTQLAWTLRPFFGSPDQDFALFRSIEGNFYAEILRTIAGL